MNAATVSAPAQLSTHTRISHGLCPSEFDFLEGVFLCSGRSNCARRVISGAHVSMSECSMACKGCPGLGIFKQNSECWIYMTDQGVMKQQEGSIVCLRRQALRPALPPPLPASLLRRPLSPPTLKVEAPMSPLAMAPVFALAPAPPRTSVISDLSSRHPNAVISMIAILTVCATTSFALSATWLCVFFWRCWRSRPSSQKETRAQRHDASARGRARSRLRPSQIGQLSGRYMLQPMDMDTNDPPEVEVDELPAKAVCNNGAALHRQWVP